ncbi:uncharacterized protein LAESUDRAFT_813939 [Laetiporus sulphureus 93-53]|uniref:HAD-superfamily phosphatase n=1 Tax=Laetiporus sulphureus 93-53 TaxID=1314785 RepID=A0A165DGL6_9APHY|nr:uncharacterized protein LAESUDRAFT_813939 [Laetiporus sulphureus 93-53]KZT04840.1 hypothetical protein LAESUDRAFT_813939 [Laetiporus sulphureus 93-53]
MRQAIILGLGLQLSDDAEKDIRQLDFPELYRAGYRGAVFDKDNCLTLPHQDTLVPELKEAWEECKQTFGRDNVLIVSNSAGSRLDGGEIEAESVSYHLNAPVLRHLAYKPSYSCIAAIRAYFSSLPTPVPDEQLIVVGDRLLTDVIMANRMARQRPAQRPPHASKERDTLASEQGVRQAGVSETVMQRVGPLTVWTDGVWERDSPIFRVVERRMLKAVERWWVSGDGIVPGVQNVQRFMRNIPQEVPLKEEALWLRAWNSFRRS